MEISQPLVSIIVPIYNAQTTLAKTLGSIVQQSYQSWEALLVLDAKSSDQSEKISLQFCQEDPRFKIIYSEDKSGGVAHNRNLGLATAKGTLLCFLDADDLWLSTKLEKQVKVFSDSTVEFCCHTFQPIDRDDRPLGPPRVPRLKISYFDLLKNNDIGCSTVMMRRSSLGEHKFEALKHEDLLLWLELTKQGKSFTGLTDQLSFYRVAPSSVSGNKLKSIVWRFNIYRRIGLSRLESCYYFISYVFTGIKKRL